MIIISNIIKILRENWFDYQNFYLMFLEFIKAFDSQILKFYSIILNFDSFKMFYVSYKI